MRGFTAEEVLQNIAEINFLENDLNCVNSNHFITVKFFPKYKQGSVSQICNQVIWSSPGFFVKKR